MNEAELGRIEARFDAFAAWFRRWMDNSAGYDIEAAGEDFDQVEHDVKVLIEHARARL